MQSLATFFFGLKESNIVTVKKFRKKEDTLAKQKCNWEILNFDNY